MLSDEILRTFVFIVRASSYCNGSPFTWCSKRRQLKLTKRSWYHLYFGMFFLHCYFFYLLTVFAVEFSSGKPKLITLPLAFGTFMMTICTLLVMYNMAFHAETILFYWNSFDIFCRTMQERYIRKGMVIPKTGLEPYLPILVFGTVFFPIGYILFFLENPSHKIFITSPLMGYLDKKYVFISTLLMAPACFSIFFGVTTGLALNLLVFGIPLFVANALSKEMIPRKHPGKPYFTSHTLRKPYNLVPIYRAITIYKILINQIISPIILPIQNVLSYCIIICNFCLINFSRRLDIKSLLIVAGMSVSCLSAWVVALWFSGMALKISNSRISCLAKYNWPNDNEPQKKYAKKAVKSFRPVFIKAGGFYIVRIVMTLKFINFAIWGTMKALLAYNNSA
ncbi:unnamed protein product [Orchesella dallaii]|uniref:Odorant receptor n=1 Tax=Orchesella dallaii TaxID=48710 RepID=A0ABP1R834_9HEXA